MLHPKAVYILAIKINYYNVLVSVLVANKLNVFLIDLNGFRFILFIVSFNSFFNKFVVLKAKESMQSCHSLMVLFNSLYAFVHGYRYFTTYKIIANLNVFLQAIAF